MMEEEVCAEGDFLVQESDCVLVCLFCGCKPTVLIEFPSFGDVGFGYGSKDFFTVADHQGCVVELAFPGQGQAEYHQGATGRGFPDDSAGLGFHFFQEGGLLEEVSTGVSGEGEFREKNDVGSLFAGLDEVFYNGICIGFYGCGLQGWCNRTDTHVADFVHFCVTALLLILIIFYLPSFIIW